MRDFQYYHKVSTRNVNINQENAVAVQMYLMIMIIGGWAKLSVLTEQNHFLITAIFNARDARLISSISVKHSLGSRRPILSAIMLLLGSYGRYMDLQ